MSGPFTGTHHLVRLILRRDRIRLPLWLLGLGGVIAISAYAVPATYDTPEAVASYEATIGTSAVGYLMAGRQVALDTIGGITANEISQVATIGIALMAMFLVVRHTRAEEETGRAEMLRSTVLGRHAATLTAGLYGVAASLVIGAITTATMVGAGLEATGSIAYGAGLALLGVTFVGITLVTAQLATTARGALGLAGAALGVTYLVRGIGAMEDNALVWLSPFGWAQKVDAFGDEQWWTLGLLLVAAAALFGVAAYLTAHRDFAGGLLEPRPGSPRASGSLATASGLALRLQRGLILGWAAGLLVLALIYGAVVPLVPELMESNPAMGEMMGVEGFTAQMAIDAFLSYIFVFMAMLTSAFAVSSALRLRSEEDAGRAESLLATGLSRTRWVLGSLAVTVLGTLLLLLVNGIGIAAGYALASSDSAGFGRHIVDQLSYAPGVLVIVGVAFALAGLLPRLAMLAWALVAVVFLQSLLGETLRLPDAVNGISPFWHLPVVPSESWTATPGLVLVALALAAGAAGVAGIRRRDIG